MNEHPERPTDQEVKDQQSSELDQAREERNARLGIGDHTVYDPQPPLESEKDEDEQ